MSNSEIFASIAGQQFALYYQGAANHSALLRQIGTGLAAGALQDQLLQSLVDNNLKNMLSHWLRTVLDEEQTGDFNLRRYFTVDKNTDLFTDLVLLEHFTDLVLLAQKGLKITYEQRSSLFLVGTTWESRSVELINTSPRSRAHAYCALSAIAFIFCLWPDARQVALHLASASHNIAGAAAHHNNHEANYERYAYILMRLWQLLVNARDQAEQQMEIISAAQA